jgi:hypothetical protein
MEIGMERTGSFFSRLWICAAAGIAIFALSACNSEPPSRKAEEKSAKAASSAVAPAAQNSTQYDIDLNCVVDHIQNPTESFHYSYKKESPDDALDEEADVTPQTIDGTSKNKFASHQFHGVRSDTASWQAAMPYVMAISGASSGFALVHSSSSEVREGSEQVNGYDTVRYSIDTSRATPVESQLYRSTMGPGGYEKGTVWVTAQGCPVKFSLDSMMHLNNGTDYKVHYEEAMVKKQG